MSAAPPPLAQLDTRAFPSFHHPSSSSSLLLAQPPAPPSPSSTTFDLSPHYFRNAVHEVQSVLYGGRGRDHAEIERVVGQLYATGAAFENPLTLARGKDAIKDMFALLALVPGTMWSEMGDVTESVGFDGNRLLIFTHTLHISLLPFLDSENARHFPGTTTATPSMRRSYSFFSLPATPFAQTPSATHASIDDNNDQDSTSPTSGLYSKTHPAFSATRWPSTSLLSLLNPKTIASSLTTLHVKLHTRLLFNEDGRIIGHEDLWGVKELVEGIFPVVGHLYSLNRQGLAWAAGLASRTLLGSSSGGNDKKALEAAKAKEKERDLEAAYGSAAADRGSPQGFRQQIKVLHPDLTLSAAALAGRGLEAPRELPSSNGLGLVDSPAVPGETRRAVPTTMQEDGEE
ncbi:hypothetical protein JCM8547_006540 [Rhodosporidiobolus lusitaniae]